MNPRLRAAAVWDESRLKRSAVRWTVFASLTPDDEDLLPLSSQPYWSAVNVSANGWQRLTSAPSRCDCVWSCGCNPGGFEPPPQHPDHNQPGRLSPRGLWVGSICRRSQRMVLIRVVTVSSRAYRYGNMGKGCMTATKYFLFLLNLIFFVSISPQDASDSAEDEG